ncbi:hypothetical protein A2V49_02225 [candidate division WWE3 bacterium RBG_19FT_COMBO_34_6]|uniref:Polysaccharide biosynthesis protein C-terminal domain-containing protein n=1 Tax=candidate division WWE3 bacterium RBG_19FT_COMBO_34_6 TaxID=1802612 RepID=A0A1F4UJK5_UNCKA|nr:MAG: hypothetical protein A2V49_02225 [candidate division WWE3 bacterium RBG_19FT_COMBO_34_6]
MLYAKKLTHISDAVTDVNLPVFSEKYVKDINDFKKVFESNFNKIFVLIIFSAMSAIFWAKDIIYVLIGSNKYDLAIPLLAPMVFTFVFYSIINILESSIAIPAKLVKDIILGFLLMLGVTIGTYLAGKTLAPPLYIMSYSMLAGTIMGFFYLVFILQKRLNFKFINHSHFLILIQGLVISYGGYLENIWVKGSLYILYCLLFVWGVFVSEFISKKQVKYLVSKSFEKVRLFIK